jgi:hypothetical protein
VSCQAARANRLPSVGLAPGVCADKAIRSSLDGRRCGHGVSARLLAAAVDAGRGRPYILAVTPLSVLDLSPIVQRGDAAQSLRDTLDLTRHAERWRYRRYWLAEHHNSPGIASAATAVVLGHVAVMLGLNVCAADTDEEAKRLFSSHQQAVINRRSGRRGPLPRPVEDLDSRLDPVAKMILQQALSCSVVGSPETVKRGLEAFIDGTDEIMVAAQIFDHAARCVHSRSLPKFTRRSARRHKGWNTYDEVNFFGVTRGKRRGHRNSGSRR